MGARAGDKASAQAVTLAGPSISKGWQDWRPKVLWGGRCKSPPSQLALASVEGELRGGSAGEEGSLLASLHPDLP